MGITFFPPWLLTLARDRALYRYSPTFLGLPAPHAPNPLRPFRGGLLPHRALSCSGFTGWWSSWHCLTEQTWFRPHRKKVFLVFVTMWGSWTLKDENELWLWGWEGLGPMTIRLGFGNPGNHNRLILHFLLGCYGHRGQPVYYYLKNLYLCLWGSNCRAVASSVAGYALHSAPTEGWRTALPPDELFRPRQRLPGVPVRWVGEFPNEVESEETRQVSSRKRRCVYSFQWFLTDWQMTKFHSNMQPSWKGNMSNSKVMKRNKQKFNWIPVGFLVFWFTSMML